VAASRYVGAKRFPGLAIEFNGLAFGDCTAAVGRPSGEFSSKFEVCGFAIAVLFGCCGPAGFGSAADRIDGEAEVENPLHSVLDPPIAAQASAALRAFSVAQEM
jgi:hypothetical protein